MDGKFIHIQILSHKTFKRKMRMMILVHLVYTSSSSLVAAVCQSTTTMQQLGPCRIKWSSVRTITRTISDQRIN